MKPHDPRALRAERGERVRERLDQRLVPDAYYLSRSARGVRQRAEQIECGVHAEFAAHASDARGRAVVERREHEADADLVQTIFGDLSRCADVDAERGQNVCAPRTTCRGAAPVLRDGESSARDDEGRGGRDVESLGRARTRARRVNEAGVARAYAHGSRAHRGRKPRQLLDRLALHGEGHERRADLRVGRAAFKQRVEQSRRLLTPQILAAHQTQRELA